MTKNKETQKSIKNILDEFESLNNSSIKPLPPISAKAATSEKTHWISPEKNCAGAPKVVKMEEKLRREIEEITNPKTANTFISKAADNPKPFSSYLRSEVPIEHGIPLSDATFSLSKKDARKSQMDIHKQVVRNDLGHKEKRKELIPTRNDDIGSLCQSAEREIERYSQHSEFLTKIFKEYKLYIAELEEKLSNRNVTESQSGKLSEVELALNTLEQTKIKALEEIENVQNIGKEKVEQIVKIVEEEIDPEYEPCTQNTIRKAQELQRRIDYSKQLSKEISLYRSWNVPLEQDLVLDEKDLREKIAKVRRINGDFGKIDELVALYDEIEAKAILLEKPV